MIEGIKNARKEIQRIMDMDAADIASLPALWRYASALLRLLWQVVRRFVEDRCIQRASALAYASLLAMVPLLVLCFSIFSSFPVFEATASRVLNWGLQFLIPASQDALKDYLGSVTGKSGALSAFGVVGLLITVTALLTTVEEAFNDIWRVPTARPLLSRFFVFWSLLTLSPVLIAISMSITSYFAALPVLQGMAAGASNIRHIPFLLPWLISSAGMTALYKLLPNTNVPLSHAIFGGLLAGALFELSKYGFTFYVRKMADNYENIYGVLATLPLLLLWIYLVWVIVLVGAEMAFCLQHPEASRRCANWLTRPGVRHFYQHLIVMRAAQALQLGKPLRLSELGRETDLPSSLLQHWLGELEEKHLLRRLSEPDDAWLLARNPASLTLREICDIIIPPAIDIPNAYSDHPLSQRLQELQAHQQPQCHETAGAVTLQDLLSRIPPSQEKTADGRV